MRLPNQAFYWQGCLIVVAGLLAAAGYIFKGSADDGSSQPAPEPISSVPFSIAIRCNRARNTARVSRI